MPLKSPLNPLKGTLAAVEVGVEFDSNSKPVMQILNSRFRGPGGSAKKKIDVRSIFFSVIIKGTLVHYSCNIHGVHSFFSSLFIVRNLIILLNFIDEARDVDKNVCF